jgi:leucyl-tRNA synthetase
MADALHAQQSTFSVQEYTLIKMQALELPGKLAGLAQHGTVYFMAATLRPETMYGQTNCWVLPDGQYGAFAAPDNQVYLMCAPGGVPVHALTVPPSC